MKNETRFLIVRSTIFRNEFHYRITIYNKKNTINWGNWSMYSIRITRVPSSCASTHVEFHFSTRMGSSSSALSNETFTCLICLAFKPVSWRKNYENQQELKSNILENNFTNFSVCFCFLDGILGRFSIFLFPTGVCLSLWLIFFKYLERPQLAACDSVSTMTFHVRIKMCSVFMVRTKNIYGNVETTV